jgi:alpha-tubulin suppressor-like RCC1 family protein
VPNKFIAEAFTVPVFERWPFFKIWTESLRSFDALRGIHIKDLFVTKSTLLFIPGLSAIAIAAGKRHTCALRSDGSVACWGDNGFGQLGVGFSRTVGRSPGYSLTAVNLGSGENLHSLGEGS